MTFTTFSEASVTSSLRRLLVVAAMVGAGAATAQPANDECANAQLVPAAGPFPYLTTTVSLANTAPDSDAPFSCQPDNNSSVWYVFTPSVSATYNFNTCLAPGNTLSDTVIAVYTDSCGSPLQAACDDDACDPGLKSSVTLALTAGTTYFIQVAKYGDLTSFGTPPSATDTMQVEVQQFLSPVAPSNDSCSGTVPDLVLNAPQQVSLNGAASNDSQVGGGAACFLGTGHSTSTTNNAGLGPDAVFRFVPPSSGTYSLRATPSGTAADSVIYLTDSCVSPMTPPQINSPPQCIAAANRVSSSAVSAEELVCIPLTAAVPVYLWTDLTADAGFTSTTYSVEVSQCFPETEPNDAPTTPNALSCPLTGRISPSGEADFFSLGTPTLPARVFAMIDGNASGSSGFSTTDFDLRVTSATSTLEYDDEDLENPFGSLAPTVTGTPLGATDNFLRVSHFSSFTTTEPYRLYAVVQTATPAPEVEPNDTTPAATTSPGNYFAGSVASTTDVDLFSFEARAGELLFLSLDSAPARTAGPTANLNLALLDSTGATLLATADTNTVVQVDAGTGLTAIIPNSPGESLVYRARTAGTYFARVSRVAATGQSDYLLSVAFDCQPSVGPPTLTALTPATGSFVGGTQVTLTGTNFAPGAVVTFGTRQAQVVSNNGTTLVVNTPTSPAGVVDVRVQNPANQAATLPSAFTFFEPVVAPTVTSVTPNGGPTAGGTNVVILGQVFKPNAQVIFTVGAVDVPATNVVVQNAVQLTATAPAHAAGPATVTVRNPADALQGSLVGGFTFFAPPTLTSVLPATGLTTGGTPVTLQGTGFRAGITVLFGTTAATSVTVVSPTELSVVAPVAATPGVVSLTVRNTDNQTATLPAAFTYTLPAPSIASVVPNSGFTSGGTTITINGANFFIGATVSVGGVAATNVVRVSATRLTANTPPGAAGAANVVVTNTDTQSVTLTGGFTYVAPPTLSAISPTNGPVQGGTRITLTGTNLVQGATVTIGGVPAFAVNVVNSTTATAVTNSNTAGVRDVRLVNPDTQGVTLTQAYTFDPAPELTAAAPRTGTTAGGTSVTLTGTGFLPGCTVLFGQDAATQVTINSPTELTAVSPARAEGVVTLTARNPDGQFAVLPRAFRFVAPPTLTALTPTSGDVAGGTLVRLTGTNFAPGAAVSFGGVPSTEVTYVSATELTALAPPHPRGAVDVVVDSSGAAVTLAAAFTYTRAAPSLVQLAPTSGAIEGGTTLTLTGSGFADGASIIIGGNAATNVVVVSPLLARATVPAHAPGAVDVVFTNDDGQTATLVAGFTFVAPPDGTTGTLTDGGIGSIGTEPVGGGGGGGQGGVSCGCTSLDGSMVSLLGFVVVTVLSRRRRQ